jgi:hypothetical protein
MVLRRRSRLIVETLEDRITPTVKAMIDAQNILQITYVGDDTANLAVNAAGTMLTITDQISNPVAGSPFDTTKFNAINILGNTGNNDVASFNSDFLFANNNLQTITEKQLTSVRTGSNAASETITTTGTQTYDDAYIFADNVTFNTTGTDMKSSGGDLAFLGTADGTTAYKQTLTLTAGAGTIHFGGVVGGMTPLGAVTINAANKVLADHDFTAASLNQTVASMSDVTFSGKITTAGAPGMAGGNVTLNAGGVLTVGDAISAVGGTATMGGLAGGTVMLTGASVSVTSVDTSGSAAVANSTLDGGAAGAISINATTPTNGAITVKSGLTALGGAGAGTGKPGMGGHLTLISDVLTLPNFAGTLKTTDFIDLQPIAAGDDIGVGDGAAGILKISSADLNTLADGFKMLTIGRTDGAGTVTVNQVTLIGPVVIESPSIGGSIKVTSSAPANPGITTLDSDDSVTLTGSGKTTHLTANIVTNSAAIQINDSVELDANILLDTTNNGMAAGAAIGITGAVNADMAANNRTFTLTAGTGAIELDGAVGTVGMQALGSLTTNGSGATTLKGGAVTTNMGQTYNEGVVVNAATTTFTTGAAATAKFASTLSSAASQDVVVSGNAEFDNAVTSLKSLKVTGTTAIDTTTITTSGDQNYQGAVTLGASPNLTTGGTVNFGSTLDDTVADGTHDLTITGNATFADKVGNAIKLKSLTVTGTAGINTSSITTTGAQNYQGAATLGTSATLKGTTVAFGSTLDESGGGGTDDLKITGNATFADKVGNAAKLKSLTVTGTTSINTSTITTAGGQNYNGAVTLGTSATLTGTTVAFGSTLDESGAGGMDDLTVTGNATFANTVGSAAKLKSLTVTGTTGINTTAITTTGNQSYGQKVTLGANPTLTGASVTFQDSVAGGSHSLDVEGNATFGTGTGDSVSGVTTLTVSGNTTINAGNITTTDKQLYGKTSSTTLTLGAAAAITLDSTAGSAAGADITVAGAISDDATASSLTLKAGTGGNVVLNGTGATPIGSSLTVTSNNITLQTAQLSTLGAVSLTAQNAISVNAALDAGASTISIMANQDGMGTEGFTQSAPISTTNDTANAVRIVVNTNTGGTGSASLNSIKTNTLTNGAINVNVNGGSITQATGTTLTANSLVLRAATGIGTIFSQVSNLAFKNTMSASATVPSLVVISNTGSLTLAALDGLTQSENDGGDVTLCAMGTTADLTLNTPLVAKGTVAGSTPTVRLSVGRKLSQGTNDTITTTDLGVIAGGDIKLDQTNHVTGTIALSGGNTTFNTDSSITIGSISSGDCFTGGASGIDGGNGDKTICSGGDIAVTSAITTTGTVRLSAGGQVTQTSGGIITAAQLGVLAKNGILLDTDVNQVSNLFAANNSATNDVKFRDSATTLTIGTVGMADCFPSNAVGVVNMGNNVTIGNTTGNLVIGNGNAGEGITANGSGVIRLSAQSGSVSQGSVGVISGVNLGVLAQSGITLDAAVNQVTGLFAAKDTGSGSVKFRNGGGTLTIGTVGSDSPAFGTAVVGVSSPVDVTIDNTTGNLVIGNGNAGEGITAGASGTVRLAADAGAVTQGSVGVISSANLGVLAQSGVTLDQAVNSVTALLAISDTTSSAIAFRDQATKLTIGTVDKDATSPGFTSAVVGVKGPNDVTLNNTTGDLVIGNGNASEGITAGSGNTVRLKTDAGAVSQVSVGIISGANLGVQAATGIALDGALNTITSVTALADSGSGTVKLRNDSTKLTVGTVVQAAGSPASIATIHGVTGPADVTLSNTGNLVIGNGAAGEGITTGTTSTARLNSDKQSVSQVAVGVISTANLGVQAGQGIALAQTTNLVTGKFAAKAIAGTVAFQDKASTLTIDSVSMDSPAFSNSVTGVSAGMTGATTPAGTPDVLITVLNDGTPGTGNLTVNQLVKSVGPDGILFNLDKDLTINPLGATPSTVQIDAGTGSLFKANVGQHVIPASNGTPITTVSVNAEILAKEAQLLALKDAPSNRDNFQIRPTTSKTPIHVVGELPTTAPGDTLSVKLSDVSASTMVRPQLSANDPNTTFLTQSAAPGAVNLHGTYSFVDANNTEVRGRVIFEGIETLGGLSLTVTSVQLSNSSAPIMVTGSLLDTTGATPGNSRNVFLPLQSAASLVSAKTAALVSPTFVSPTSPFSAARVAVADVNGDGIPDFILANGPGNNNPPTIRVVDGSFVTSGRTFNPATDVLAEFTVFDPRFRGGLSVAAGILSPKTTKASIVVGLDSNGPPIVSVFDYDPSMPGHVRLVTTFQPYDSSFQGGVRVAVGSAVPGDTTGNPIIVVAPGPGAALPVEVYNAIVMHDEPNNPNGKQPIATFFPYGSNYSDGVVVDAGNPQFGMTTNEIITGNQLGQPHIRMFGPSTNYQTPELDHVAFQGNDVVIPSDPSQPMQTITEKFTQANGVFRFVPPNGVSSVSFGSFSTNSTRDIIVGAGVGKQALTVKLSQKTNNPPLRRTAWAHGRVPRGINIRAGGA